MKSLTKSKTFIAVMLAFICIGVLITCMLWGQSEQHKFVPDVVNLTAPIESWTENTTVPHSAEIISADAGNSEFKPVSYISTRQPASTTATSSVSETEEETTEAPEEIKTEPEIESETVIYLNDPVTIRELPPETPGNNDDMPEELPEHVGIPHSSPESVMPAPGSVNGNGEVYVQGFGWIKHSGPNQGRSSGSDGDWNKQIGSMN